MKISCVISCSFRHLDEIACLKEKLNALEVAVLAPIDTRIKTAKGDFIILEADRSDDPGELEANFMMAICRADFHYVFLPDRRLGASVAAEAAWAWYHCTPSIWSCFPPEDISSETDIQLVSVFSSPSWLPDGILTPQELTQRIEKGIISKGLLSAFRERKLSFFRLFDFI